MKTADYRDLISALSDAFASLRSVANDQEREKETSRVQAAARELMAADCPRASKKDRETAQRLIDMTAVYISERCITCPTCGKMFRPVSHPNRERCMACIRADVNLTRMAFGAEYR